MTLIWEIREGGGSWQIGTADKMPILPAAARPLTIFLIAFSDGSYFLHTLVSLFATTSLIGLFVVNHFVTIYLIGLVSQSL